MIFAVGRAAIALAAFADLATLVFIAFFAAVAALTTLWARVGRLALAFFGARFTDLAAGRAFAIDRLAGRRAVFFGAALVALETRRALVATDFLAVLAL